MTNKNVRERLTSFYADAVLPGGDVPPAEHPTTHGYAVKTPDAVKRAAATNTRRRMVLHAGPELIGTTQLAAELGLAPSTLKKLAVRMGCAKLGRAFYFSKEQADAVRADPPRGRVRTPKNGKVVKP